MGTHQEYRFNDFVVDLDGWQLYHSDQIIHLEPSGLRLLVYLIEHRDRLVSKQELMDTVWGDTVVSESALSKAVARLRHALHDDAADPKYIETAYALGYRFIAQVHETAPRKDQAPELAHPRRRRRPVLVMTGVLMMAALLWVDPLQWREPATNGGNDSPIRSLAVLPLDNLSGDPDLEYFVEGLQDVLITDLSKTGDLEVISRQSTLRYRSSEQSAPEIARQLDVDALIEGGVLLRGDRVKVTAQLIDGKSDRHLWAQTYDREVADVLTLLSEIARAISMEVEVVLSPQQEERLAQAGPIDPRVSEAYLRATYLMNRFNPADLLESLDHLESAVEIDPSFAPAWGALAAAHLTMAYYGSNSPSKQLTQGRIAALRALELDSQEFSGHAAMAWISLFTWDWQGAGQAFERALRLNPNHTTTIHGYADYLTLTGRPEEGLAQVRRAARIDPHSPMSNLPVPFHLYLMRHYDEALSELHKLQDKRSDYPVHQHFMLVLWQQGRREESLAAYRKFLLAKGDSNVLEALERGYESAGPEGALRAVAGAMAERFETRYVEPFQIASLYAQTGDVALAFEWLEKALERGSVQLIYVGVRPEFEALIADPRYVELLRGLGIVIPQTGPAS